MIVRISGCYWSHPLGGLGGNMEIHSERGLKEIQPGDRYLVLERLVDELIKKTPEKEFVKECMGIVGLEYVENPIECINRVLSALQMEEPRKEILDEKKP